MGKPSLGERIRKLRKKSGLSQMDLELAIQTGYGSISRIENNEVNPTKETLLKIINHLDVPLHETIDLFNLETKDIINLIEISGRLTVLNLKEVLQKSVNDICYQLNLIGSLIVIIKEGKIHSEAATQTWFIKPVFKILNIAYEDFNTLSLSLEDKNNYFIKGIKNHKINYSSNLQDYLCPVVSKGIATAIQKLTRGKSYISIPIEYNQQTLGSILFAKNYIDDFSSELEVLQAFTNNIANAIYNALEYKTLKDEVITLKSKLKKYEEN